MKKSNRAQFGVYVGRLCPIHVGHERVIQTMLDECGAQSILLLGSANTPCSIKYFFSYQERRDLVRALFPELKIAALSDFPTDEEWFEAMDDLLRCLGQNPREVLYYGGSLEDIEFYVKAGRKYKILNRYEGSTPVVSASQVRDALIEHRSLDGLVNPEIRDRVNQLFREKWERFKRT